MLEAHLEAGRDALEVVRQQTLGEVPRGLARRPRHASALVGAEQHAAALLAGVDLALEVDAVQLLLLAPEERNVLGDQVLVLHREDRQLEAHHATYFARPQPAGVHHVLGVHVAGFGDHIPGAVGARLQVHDARVADDLGTADLRRLGIGLGDAPGVDVTFDRIEQCADEVLLVHQREEPRRLLGRDELQLHAEVAAARLGHLQPVEALAGAGEHQAAG